MKNKHYYWEIKLVHVKCYNDMKVSGPNCIYKKRWIKSRAKAITLYEELKNKINENIVKYDESNFDLSKRTFNGSCYYVHKFCIIECIPTNNESDLYLVYIFRVRK